MQHELVLYKGWENCVRLSNDTVDLIVTTEVGPRIIRFGFVGDVNELCEFPEELGKKGGDDWRIYGGHRLWHSPEMIPRTYFPDNFPVRTELLENCLRVIQPVETTTGIEKEMDIWLDERKASVRVTHRLRNKGMWDVELSAWALTVMAPGGTAIIPLPPRATHSENLSPVNTITMWAYTDFSDPRWRFGSRFILLHQDDEANSPQKIGAAVPPGWAAFSRDHHLFLKRVDFKTGAKYPDGGSSVEVFTNDAMTELETLSPITRLEPGAEIEHVETWDLFANVSQPSVESDVDEYIMPVIAKLI